MRYELIVVEGPSAGADVRLQRSKNPQRLSKAKKKARQDCYCDLMGSGPLS